MVQGNAVTASATWKEVEFEPDLSASVAAGTLKKLSIGGWYVYSSRF